AIEQAVQLLASHPAMGRQGASRGLANWWLRVRPTSSRIGYVRAEWKFCASSTPPGSGRQICEAEFKRCATPRGMPKSAKLLCLAHEAPSGHESLAALDSFPAGRGL